MMSFINYAEIYYFFRFTKNNTNNKYNDFIINDQIINDKYINFLSQETELLSYDYNDLL